MISFNKIERLKKINISVFILFLFFSAIFCGFTRVNNLLHVSIILFIIGLFISKEMRQIFSVNNARKKSFIFTLLFLLYFSLSNLWGSKPYNIESSLSHSLYIMMFLGMMVMVLESKYRTTMIYACILGLLCLSIYCIAFEYRSISHLRMVSNHNPGPTNVIDLSGYAAIGVLLTLIAFRDTKKKILLLALPVFVTILIISQSRGPIIALLVPLLITFPFSKVSKKQAFFALIMILFIFVGLIYSTLGEQIITRFTDLYTQSFLRLSIWSHTLELFYDAPIFGHGFDYHLEFTNYSGEHIRTTHSVYFGALLKGGIVGLLLLLLMLAYSLKNVIKSARNGHRLELCLFAFMMMFYLSQGLFVISNPTEYWYIFWFPLAFGLVGHTDKPLTRTQQ